MKPPVRIAVTGGAGQIAYSLLFRIAAGELLGPEQPVILHLLELPQALGTLHGTVMELDDCAFPLLEKVVVTDDAEIAFQDAGYVFLVGAVPRGAGMERKDLLHVNAEIFKVQGRALDTSARRDVKVLIVGNPANTNAYITMKSAPALDPRNFSGMMRLDHNRALAQLAQKTASKIGDIRRLVVWGNHSATQYPDLSFVTVAGTPVVELVSAAWIEQEFRPAVQQRGTAIIEARGKSSVASAANAALDHMRDWIFGTPEDDWVSMAVPSDGSYGIPEGLMYSFPVRIRNGAYEIVSDLEIGAASRAGMDASRQELEEEQAAVSGLLV